MVGGAAAAECWHKNAWLFVYKATKLCPATTTAAENAWSFSAARLQKKTSAARVRTQESGVKTHIPIMQCWDMKCALHITYNI